MPSDVISSGESDGTGADARKSTDKWQKSIMSQIQDLNKQLSQGEPPKGRRKPKKVVTLADIGSDTDSEMETEAGVSNPQPGTSGDSTIGIQPSPNPGSKKRQRISDSPNSQKSLVETSKKVIPAMEKCHQIRCIIMDGSNRLNKSDKIQLNEILDDLMTEITHLMLDLNTMQTRSSTIDKMLQAQSSLSQKLDTAIKARPSATMEPQIKSYASATAGLPNSRKVVINGFERPLPPKPLTILVYPNVPEGETSEATQKKLEKAINPKTDDFQVVRLRKIKGAGMALQAKDVKGLDNIKKAESKLAASGLKIVNPMGRLPKIVIYNVPKGEPTADQVLFTEIYTNNLEGHTTLTLEDHLRTMRRVSLFGKRDSGTMNMVLTCHPAARKVLLDSGMCFLGWNACRTRDFTGATRCFKCHQYGHISRSCSQDNETCRHCAAVGHDFETCPKKAQPAVCATCTRFKKPADHPTGDRVCPAQKAAVEAAFRMTDYGSS